MIAQNLPVDESLHKHPAESAGISCVLSLVPEIRHIVFVMQPTQRAVYLQPTVGGPAGLPTVNTAAQHVRLLLHTLLPPDDGLLGSPKQVEV
jgi:hypothetical protein